ncbi:MULTISPECIES: 2-hydroxyacid dehydrogenase [Oceanobacillus]|uniref:D-glycerate dehydrogenase n=1 Tax=Oceanobacillus profundus TaxID=372463 RepID=A0A417YCB1_9BACI|nr:D-glycerate dehydrogenase [Oceanobacillus profundus]MCM3399823.1 D-glycerate dehydrogenase [Oceanobacillus profundus]PAE30312.1 bifunctional glyoxylate/hydroxypyruvate reductase B [Paenibacillus sp. 7884-2]RHW30323.1 D-glycerate dehydrogenase [Oceanobacillus profundus]
MKKIIVYNPIYSDLLKILQKHFQVVELTNVENPEFIHELKDAHGIIGSGLKVDRTLLDEAPNLEIICNISVGYDNLDMEAVNARGIMATNTPDVLTDSTADTIFGLLLATARRITELDQYVKSGQWTGKIGEDLYGVDIHHKTLGIIGMGRIGKAIAERAHFGFKMKILYHNRSRKLNAEEQLQAEYVSLQKLLQQSDFVCLMAPLSPETVQLIGKQEFSLMKKTAIFVNGARGQMVDEDALVEALKKREICAAGLDVYEKEPVEPNNPLLYMKNVVTLPHIGSATLETRYKMAKLAAENLIKGLQGEIPPSLINKEVFI